MENFACMVYWFQDSAFVYWKQKVPKEYTLRFPIWKPAPGNNDPSSVPIQGSDAIYLVYFERSKSCDTILDINIWDWDFVAKNQHCFQEPKD